MNPPKIMGKTIVHKKDSNPKINPNVIVAAKLIIGSVASTVPTAFLGSEPPKIKTGVTKGPHPPPPNASKKAAVNPSRGANLFGSFCFIIMCFLANLNSMIMPIPSSIKLTKGLASEKDIQERKLAPKTAPTMPGIANLQKKPFSIFPSFQCDNADTKSTNPSDVWMLALAVAGVIPNVINTDTAETPYPIPRAESMKPHTSPTIKNMRKLSILVFHL